MTSAKTFEDLKLTPWIVRQLKAVGISRPTPIQEQCIPEIMAGKDVIGVAKTGSGKTLAFALPILHHLAEEPYGIFAVVVTPTRELAYQIKESFAVIGKCMNLRQCVVIGGLEMIDQGTELARRPHIVIATPGRLYDHLNSCDTFHFRRMKYLVLDEADKLLGGPFDEEMKGIFAAVPQEKQMLLFSATMTDVLDKVKAVAKKEVFVSLEPSAVKTVEQLKQFYVLCPQYVRDGYLVEAMRRFMEKRPDTSIIIFTDTCKNCQVLSMMLNLVGFENVALHKMMHQKERLKSLAQFKSNRVNLLVATDLASRGLDIPLVELVINYNVPNAVKNYIHRVGRTARAGRLGYAITLVTPVDVKLVQNIEDEINTKLEEYKVDAQEVAKIFTHISVTRRECEIQVDQSEFYERKEINKKKQKMIDAADKVEEIQDKIIEKLKAKRKKSGKSKSTVKVKKLKKRRRKSNKKTEAAATS
ncbi:ATP-dependent RNA helicase [Nesidiocoris tenuis]|uniref:RNA helicase n=1 Tax=Nesidiocoris tenuis TaxID=355587 RepID=A0ABN7BGL4_9HEMI|nr:ATP-dependent RNA helicase [Nesidiocoris tenuis]